MLNRFDIDQKKIAIDDYYEKMTDLERMKFNAKVVKKRIYYDKALYLWTFFGWFGFHQLYLKNYGAFVLRFLTMSGFLTLWFKDRFDLKDAVREYNINVEFDALLDRL